MPDGSDIALVLEFVAIVEALSQHLCGTHHYTMCYINNAVHVSKQRHKHVVSAEGP